MMLWSRIIVKHFHLQSSVLQTRIFIPRYQCTARNYVSKDSKDESPVAEFGNIKPNSINYFQEYKNIYENANIFQSVGTLQTHQYAYDYHKVHESQNSIPTMMSTDSDEELAKAQQYHDMYFKQFNTIDNNEIGDESDSIQDDYYDKYYNISKNAELHSKDIKTEDELTHVNEAGQINMVDVGHKPETQRLAIAHAKVILGDKAFFLVKENKMKKGDIMSTVKIAGIMAAKNTSNLIPLCHHLAVNNVSINLTLLEDERSIAIECHARTYGKTGVEMEALTGASVAALTMYDMCKAVTHDIIITDVKLMHKSGGTSKDFYRAP